MPRAQISIKLDQAALQRVDEAAKLLECTRTTFIERACERALNKLDASIEEMERESPITAAVLDAIGSNKKVMMGRHGTGTSVAKGNEGTGLGQAFLRIPLR